jgi:transposase
MPRDLNLVSQTLGPLPLINRCLDQLRLHDFFREFVPGHNSRYKLSPAVALGVLLRNLLVARRPLYGLHEWAMRFAPSTLGLPLEGASLLNDDRVGRALDALFAADRAALMTAVVVQAVQTFHLQLRELHNDSTTVSFTGQYFTSPGDPLRGQPTHRITFGRSKDHRPDLKQLLWILTTTADGTVPVWCSIDHGNATDDRTHIQTWDTLCQLVGSPDFLYVGDTKLCTKENLEHIATGHGRFLTVLPKTRREDSWFRDWLQTHSPDWRELWRRKNSRRPHDPDEVYRGLVSPQLSAEGFRIFWIWSSQKQAHDRGLRQDRMQRAQQELEQLQARIPARWSRLRTPEQIAQAAAAILHKTQTERWIAVQVQILQEQHAVRPPGRPSPHRPCIPQTTQRYLLAWHDNTEALRYDERTDGIFPLILNDENLSLRDALLAYKHQPSLEKRHEQLKTVLEVMPVNLKSPRRIEACFFLYFLALLVEALLEREIRTSMKREGIKTLLLYPEERACKAPTAQRILELFDDVRRHYLVALDGSVQQHFSDDLTPLQRTVLRLLDLSPAAYFSLPTKESKGF